MSLSLPRAVLLLATTAFIHPANTALDDPAPRQNIEAGLSVDPTDEFDTAS